jgi:phospholipid-transporting ATPase
VNALSGSLRSEQPNNSLYTYEGTLDIKTTTGAPRQVPVGPDQLLLRGAQIRNTPWLYGLVVFTGHDTKLMRNATYVRTHVGEGYAQLGVVVRHLSNARLSSGKSTSRSFFYSSFFLCFPSARLSVAVFVWYVCLPKIDFVDLLPSSGSSLANNGTSRPN